MFTTISSATLRKMIKLSKRKEELMSQIQEIDRQMSGIEREVEVHASIRPPRRANVTTRRAFRSKPNRRGALKAKILGALRGAGQRGLTVRQLSNKLGVKSANLYVWFADTGRKVRGLKKIAPAKYRLG
jgi:type II secretory pathway component PulJ